MKTKKELKTEYKESKPQMGVFQVRNTQNNKVFIDQATNILAKWNRHQAELNFGNHRNKDFQNDWNQINHTNFVFEVLSELKTKEDEGLNIKKELKLFQDLVLEELNIPDDMKY